MDALEKEAALFARYLIKRQASPQDVKLYKVAASTSKLTGADKKLLSFMASHPKSIGLIDAGLVFHRPSSEARRRLYLMLAILEATPENSDLFLATERGPWYMVTIIYSCMRAVVKAGLGLVLIKVVE